MKSVLITKGDDELELAIANELMMDDVSEEEAEKAIAENTDENTKGDDPRASS